MKSVNKQKNKDQLIILVFLGLLTYGITCYSSSLNHSSSCPAYDSYAYRYMGMLIAKGGVPYRDAFDNKGPIMYLLNYLGYVINVEYGIFFVEYISVFLYLVCSQIIASRFTSAYSSLIYTIVSASPLSLYFVGNMTEEMALPYISIGLLIFIDYFLFKNYKWYGILLCGLSFGCVLLIRPNMVSIWAIFSLAVIIKYIIDNKKFPIRFTLLFMSALSIVLLPILMWFYHTDALTEFWKDYILANFIYSQNRYTANGFATSIVTYFTTSYLYIYIIILLYLILKKKNRFFNCFYIIYIAFNLILISMSGVVYMNYAMIIVPSLIYPISALSNHLFTENMKKKKYLFNTICILLSIVFLSFICKNIIDSTKALKNGNHGHTIDEHIVDLIKQYTEPEDRILMLGYKCYFYVASDRLSSTKFYYSCTNDNYPDGHQAVVDSVNADLPKLIVIEGGEDPENLFQHYNLYENIEPLYGIWILKE